MRILVQADQPVAAARRRCGIIVVVSAVILVVVFAFTAFTVDVGYITLTKGQLQNAADAAAKGAALELPAGLGLWATLTSDQAAAEAREAAVEVSSANRAGDSSSVYANGNRDVRFGQVLWDGATGAYQKSWGVAPYNMVEVTLHRDQGTSTNGDGNLPLFFAPVIGHETASLSVTSTAALIPGVGFRIEPGSDLLVGILPITLDEQTWNAMLYQGIGDDDWTWNEDTKQITPGGDGILEVNLYPTGSNLMPPGNRGTVDFGHSGNATSDLTRQILYGLNDDDLSYFNGELRFDQVPLIINGDTGLSAGIKDELEAVKGQPRAIPIFSEVSGPGNNAMYTIVKFVGIRILDVKLTGSPSNKHVTIQPAPFIEQTVIRGEVTVITQDAIFAPATLIP